MNHVWDLLIQGREFVWGVVRLLVLATHLFYLVDAWYVLRAVSALNLSENILAWPLLHHVVNNVMVDVVISALRAVLEHLDKVRLIQGPHFVERWDVPCLQPAQNYVLDELAGLLIRLKSVTDPSIQLDVNWHLGFDHTST